MIAPLFGSIGMNCFRADIDTNQFGAFTGEVNRVGTVRETLRKKIKSASESLGTGRFILASEGSFGPHPVDGIIQTDFESFLIWDRKLDVEIYAEFLCQQPAHGEKVLGPRDDFRAALKSLGFPEHGVIVHPDNFVVPVFNGLHRERDVAQAMIDSFMASANAKVVIKSDLRASHNPTRRKAILEAGEVLIDKLRSLCPSCSYPGFAIARGIPGLPCSSCGEPNPLSKVAVFECFRCSFTNERPRPDGSTSVNAFKCKFCNP